MVNSDKQAYGMNASSAAGQAVVTQIGFIADQKRDAAQKAADQATKDGNPELAAQYSAEAAKWDEGGTNRFALHVAGGALVAGLGGGSVASAAQGAAGGLNNPLGLDDVLNVGADQDLSFGNKSLGSHGFNGSYSVPWGFWTATLSGNTNTYYQNIAGVNQTFVSSGNSQTTALRLARALTRNQSDVFGAYVQLSKRFGESFIDDTDIPQQRRNNTFFEAGLTDRHYFGASQFDGTLAYRQGIGGLGATPDPYSTGPTYRYHMAVLDANLSVPFAVASQNFRYAATIHGQFTNDTLFYLDDLTIGSRYTVRGFDGETTLAAEKGFYWRNELQWLIFQTGQTLYAGIDYGRVFGPNTAVLAGTQLAGAVIGIRGGIPAKSAGFSYDLFAGTPIYKPSGFPTARVTGGVQATVQF